VTIWRRRAGDTPGWLPLFQPLVMDAHTTDACLSTSAGAS
jgi:hypothetical protein